MADLGAMSLWIALALSSYSLLGSVLGKQLYAPALVQSAQRAGYLVALALLVATLSLVGSFITRDFQVAYVAAHSDLAMPGRFTWVAFYAGNEGSLLYIAFALSALAGFAIWRAPRHLQDTLPYTSAVLMFVLVFFLAVIAFMANPFDKLAITPLDGEGINPLLTHLGMFFHPPLLMAGLVAISIPIAFSLGSLIGGKTADEWVDVGRQWGLIAWAMLAAGLLLGSWWAYTILGWGGFWFWDPVENAAFMPWLALTAFVHSIMVQKRRGMFRMWNIVLIDVAFSLALYGMFMNRGGPVPSVHSFGASSLGWVFLLFLGVGTLIPLAIFFWRYPLLKSAQRLDSLLSREAAFLINNLLLLGIAFITLWGTVYPLISKLTIGESITIARPFYDQINGPLFLVLLLVMGVGPLLPWRRSTPGAAWRSLWLPTAGGGVTALVLIVFGIHQPYALIGFFLAAFITTGILAEWHRGSRARGRSQGEPYPIAFLHLIWANRPRYGGYIVHLAVVMVALGVVGASFFNIQRDMVLAPGERVEIGGYEILYVGSSEVQKGNRTEFISTVELYRNGQLLEILHPQRAFYPAFNMAATRAAIRSTPVDDFYLVPSENLGNGSVGFRVLVNPLIWWMWVAGPFLVLGTLVSLWPSTARTPAVAPQPSRGPAPAAALPR